VSVRVLVIPEDPFNNGYILKPLVDAVLADVGKPLAKTQILINPRLRGYDHALKAIREDLPDRYRFWDLWIFFPDADRAGPDAMQALETDLLGKGVSLLCCPAQPETEIYCCAAHPKALGISWEEARQHPRLKEEIFGPLLNRYGDRNRVGEGRDLLIGMALKNLPHFYRLCPEIKALRDRIDSHFVMDSAR